MWRRHQGSKRTFCRPRNTSTDVEKTDECGKAGCPLQKHLHGRGEDLSYGFLTGLALETPPRTWRRPLTGEDDVTLLGNTSTDVEKTPQRIMETVSLKKHLHGRGEDMLSGHFSAPSMETPPRTWRRLEALLLGTKRSRNTSTDVEKTPRPKRRSKPSWKHLHGRGEDKDP